MPHLRSLTPSSRCCCSTPHCTTPHYTTLQKNHMLHGTSNIHLDALLLFNSMGFTIAIQRNKTAYVCWCHVPSWILCVSSLPARAWPVLHRRWQLQPAKVITIVRTMMKWLKGIPSAVPEVIALMHHAWCSLLCFARSEMPLQRNTVENWDRVSRFQIMCTAGEMLIPTDKRQVARVQPIP